MTDLSAEGLLQRCAMIATSTWSDALDEMGLNGLLSGLPKRSGGGRVAGFAVTVKQEVGELGSYESSDFAVGKMIAAVGPGRVLMVDMGGAEISTFGGLAALAAATKSTVAVVIDGAARDLDEIRTTGLWLASRHLSPRTGKRRVKVVSINDPINIGGCLVREGDLVVGDCTGIVVVPAAHLQQVLALCDAKLKIDEKMEAGIRNGKSFSEASAMARFI